MPGTTTGKLIVEALIEADLDEADRMLVATYYSWGQPDSSLAVLGRMDLSSANDTLFYDTYYMLDTALQDGRTFLDLNETEQQYMVEWSSLDYTSAFVSRNIAQALNLIEVSDTIEQWPSGKRGHDDTGDEDALSAVTVYPVPFSDDVWVVLSEPAAVGGWFIVTDLTGKEVVRLKISPWATVFNVATTEWPTGLYVGTAMSETGRIGTVKLIKQ